jgi:hypothetical protein
MSKSDDTSEITPREVAEWMLSAIQDQGELSQNNAFYEINKQFGKRLCLD